MTARNRARPVEVKGRYYTDPRVARAIVDTLPMWDGQVVLEPHAGGGVFLDALLERADAEGITIYLYAMELDPTAPSMLDSRATSGRYRRHVGDFLGPYPAGWPRPDLVLGNPPYSVREPVLDERGDHSLVTCPKCKGGRTIKTTKCSRCRGAGSILPYSVTEVATAHTLRALEISKHHVVFLMRSGFFGGLDRYDRLWSGHPHAHDDVLLPRPSYTGRGTDSNEYSAIRWSRGHEGPPTRGWLRWKT